MRYKRRERGDLRPHIGRLTSIKILLFFLNINLLLNHILSLTAGYITDKCSLMFSQIPSRGISMGNACGSSI